MSSMYIKVHTPVRTINVEGDKVCVWEKPDLAHLILWKNRRRYDMSRLAYFVEKQFYEFYWTFLDRLLSYLLPYHGVRWAETSFSQTLTLSPFKYQSSHIMAYQKVCSIQLVLAFLKYRPYLLLPLLRYISELCGKIIIFHKVHKLWWIKIKTTRIDKKC